MVLLLMPGTRPGWGPGPLSNEHRTLDSTPPYALPQMAASKQGGRLAEAPYQPH